MRQRCFSQMCSTVMMNYLNISYIDIDFFLCSEDALQPSSLFCFLLLSLKWIDEEVYRMNNLFRMKRKIVSLFTLFFIFIGPHHKATVFNVSLKSVYIFYFFYFILSLRCYCSEKKFHNYYVPKRQHIGKYFIFILCVCLTTTPPYDILCKNHLCNLKTSHHVWLSIH